MLEYLPIDLAINFSSLELHDILSESASFVTENILDLA